MLGERLYTAVDIWRRCHVPELKVVDYGTDRQIWVTIGLFDRDRAIQIPDGTVCTIWWKSSDGSIGSYQGIDGQAAYTFDENRVLIRLSDEIISSGSQVFLSAQLRNDSIDVDGDGEKDVLHVDTPVVLVCVEHQQYDPFDRTRICDPYIRATRYNVNAQSDMESYAHAEAVEPDYRSFVTVSGIYEGRVLEIKAEYFALPPEEEAREQLPVLEQESHPAVTIDIGDYDLINGHKYEVDIPLEDRFAFRGILTYSGLDGLENRIESEWFYPVDYVIPFDYSKLNDGYGQYKQSLQQPSDIGNQN